MCVNINLLTAPHICSLINCLEIARRTNITDRQTLESIHWVWHLQQTFIIRYFTNNRFLSSCGLIYSPFWTVITSMKSWILRLVWRALRTLKIYLAGNNQKFINKVCWVNNSFISLEGKYSTLTGQLFINLSFHEGVPRKLPTCSPKFSSTTHISRYNSLNPNHDEKVVKRMPEVSKETRT